MKDIRKLYMPLLILVFSILFCNCKQTKNGNSKSSSIVSDSSSYYKKVGRISIRDLKRCGFKKLTDDEFRHKVIEIFSVDINQTSDIYIEVPINVFDDSLDYHIGKWVIFKNEKIIFNTLNEDIDTARFTHDYYLDKEYQSEYQSFCNKNIITSNKLLLNGDGPDSKYLNDGSRDGQTSLDYIGQLVVNYKFKASDSLLKRVFDIIDYNLKTSSIKDISYKNIMKMISKENMLVDTVMLRKMSELNYNILYSTVAAVQVYKDRLAEMNYLKYMAAILNQLDVYDTSSIREEGFANGTRTIQEFFNQIPGLYNKLKENKFFYYEPLRSSCEDDRYKPED